MNKKTIIGRNYIALLCFVLVGTIIVLLSSFQLKRIADSGKAEPNPFASIPSTDSNVQSNIWDEAASQVEMEEANISIQRFKNIRLLGFIIITTYPAYLFLRLIFRRGGSIMTVSVRSKQIMVLWVMGILICMIFLYAPTLTDYCGIRCQNDHLNWMWIIPKCVTALIIGGLLIYTLREQR